MTYEDLQERITGAWFVICMVFVSAVVALVGWAFVMMVLTMVDFAYWVMGK